MPKVFVSHAHADKDLVEEFRDDILGTGCGLNAADVFVSSIPASGVPSGEDLLSFVRERVEATDLVIAIVTPTYQTRPVCLAEMGAAWGVSGKLFPALAPGVDRKSLEGVLGTVAIRYLDEVELLDEVHRRVAETGHTMPSAPEWTRAKSKWLNKVGPLAKALPAPRVVEPADLEAALAKNKDLEAGLAHAEAEIAQLRDLNRALEKLKDSGDVAAVLLDHDETEAFEQLREQARHALDLVDPLVRDVVRVTIRNGNGMIFPKWDSDDADAAISKGVLRYHDDENVLYLNEDVTVVREAWEAANDLHAMLESSSDSFGTWFEDRFGGRPDLSIGVVFDAVLS